MVKRRDRVLVEQPDPVCLGPLPRRRAYLLSVPRRAALAITLQVQPQPSPQLGYHTAGFRYIAPVP